MPLGQRAVARQDELADATLKAAGGTVVRVWEHESIRTSTGWVLPSSRRVVRTASPTSRFAPRGEPQAPLRSRWATITGAFVPVASVASSAFSPRTPE